MNSQVFKTPIEYLKGVGLSRAEVLKKELQIFNFEDLLRHFPYKYIDRTRFYKIREIQPDLPYVQVLARLTHVEILGEKHTRRLVAQAVDDTGIIELVWFQGIKWVEKTLMIGKAYILFGKPGFFNGKAQMAHPEMELYSTEALQRKGNITLQPAYNSTEKLKQFSLDSKGLAKLIAVLLDQQLKAINENLPLYIINRFKLIDRADAYRNIHFPQDAAKLNEAVHRLKFEELFFLQLKLLKNKLLRTQKFKGNVFGTVGIFFNEFYQYKLPFTLTNSQKRVLKEIRQDTQRGVQMNRLLQGDVGSGKTVVALMSMLIAIDNGFQTCIMAPTEILANQHYQTIKELVGDDFIEVALLTGSTKAKARKVLHEKLESGDLKILIGTHALIEDKVQYKNLGFVVIDEQHRFGVEQRAKLWRKNSIPPHILVMTATPIPRTLAMTLYGGFWISPSLTELPAGRKPIKTVHIFMKVNALADVWFYGNRKLPKKGDRYVVYPLDPGRVKKLDLKNLEDGINVMAHEFPLPTYRISVVYMAK